MKKLLSILLLLALCTALYLPAAGAEAVALTVAPQELIVAVGKTAAVKPTLEPKEARKAGVTYASSDESVATVNAQGKVKGVSAGNCTLTVTSAFDPAVSQTVAVSVVVPVKKIVPAETKLTLHNGETAALSLGYQPEDATLQSATFASSKESVATVDESGVVTAVSKGQANIVILSADGAAKASVGVKVLQSVESVTLDASSDTLVTGKRISVKATVLPKNADNKKLDWSSSDESVATVSASGQVTALAPGQVTITAASQDNPAVKGTYTLHGVRLAKTVAFSQKAYGVIIGQSAPLSVTVSPADTTDKSVTYKSNRPKIVSVDEQGVVTALAPGKAVITATTADGSRRQARATVNVIVPVTGVSFAHSDGRVGVNYHGTFTAQLQPKEATNHNMTWTSSDESVATVSGTTNKVRVSGRRWGRCVITGTTEDGGYQCTLNVNVGSLRHAVTIRSVDIRNGKPYLTLRNNSNMNITRVSLVMSGENTWGEDVTMSVRDGDYLYADYGPLAPGESTTHGYFTFYRPTNFPDLQLLNVAIIGWETDTGYYKDDGLLYYSYSVSNANAEWKTYTSPDYVGPLKK